MAALPLGPATAVPWWADGVLHVGGEEIRVRRPKTVLYRAETTLVELGSDPVRPGRW